MRNSAARAPTERSEVDELSLRNGRLRAVAKQQGALLHTAQDRTSELEAADLLKDELLATTSHDLKGPLTSIKGWTQLLLRRMQDPALDLALLTQGLETIDAHTNLLAGLVDDPLDAARIQAGFFELQTE